MALTEKNKSRSTFIIHRGSGNTIFVTIGLQVANALGFRAGDLVEWKIDRGDLILKKVKE